MSESFAVMSNCTEMMDISQTLTEVTTETVQQRSHMYKRTSHVHRLGNQNATKIHRKVEFGWLDFDNTSKSYRQVRSKRGGGTHRVAVNKKCQRNDLLELAKNYFFPNGISPKGKMEEFDFDLKDFDENSISEHFTVAEFYGKMRSKMLRLYMATKKKEFPIVEQPTTQKSYTPLCKSVSSHSYGRPHNNDEDCVNDHENFQADPQRKHLRKRSKRTSMVEVSILDDDTSEDDNYSCKLRRRARPFGNKHATKVDRKVELGWLDYNYIFRAYKQVRSNTGGGKHCISVNKTHQKRDLLDIAKSLFFPNGESVKGSVEEFDFDLKDFDKNSFDANCTVGEIYDKNPDCRMLRLYVTTKRKNIVGNETVNIAQNSNANTTKGKKANKIIVKQSNHIRMILIHRNNILNDMLNVFSDPSILSDQIDVQFVSFNGEFEEDCGEKMQRSCFADFWAEFYELLTVGNISRIPCFQNDFSDDNWQSVARIIIKGLEEANYFPIRLALPIMQLVFGKLPSPTDLVDCYLLFVSESDQNILNQATTDFKAVNKEDLELCLSQHQCRTIPTADNIGCIITELAHSELIEKTLFLINPWREILRSAASVISITDIADIYGRKIPSASKVIEKLFLPDAMNTREKAVAQHLRHFIQEIDYITLMYFLRFCTGSDIMCQEPIQVSFKAIEDMNQWPVSFTSFNSIELPLIHQNYRDLFVNLRDFLHSKIGKIIAVQ
ncbi:uncharacterized protein [Ptychodera flava]|uniref:uncharacterized protein n=1 Tax=Ptychodera flava TaxID=63121 RepID=UPI003969F43A